MFNGIIAFFVLVKYKKGQTHRFAPTRDVFNSKGKCYRQRVTIGKGGRVEFFSP